MLIRVLMAVGGLLFLTSTSALACPTPDFPDRASARASARARTAKEVGARLDGVRVPFVANQGQADPRVAYYAPGFGNTLFVTRDGELVYAMRDRGLDATRATRDGDRVEGDRSRGGPGARRARSRSLRRGFSLTETLVGGQTNVVGQDRGPTTVSDFRGSEPKRWKKDLPTYQGLGLGEVWPGISVSLQARGGQVEKVFTVQPGASVDQILVQVKGASALELSAGGALVAKHEGGDVTFTAPVAYQERDGARRTVAVAYRIEGLQYGFTVGTYDPALPLVIDPLLQSTFLGGTDDDFAYAIAIHPTTGAVYVAGDTFSFDFPGVTLDSAQPDPGGCGCTSDAFVALLSSDLTTLVQATYLGGFGTDGANALTINASTGDVYVAGITRSDDFPIPPGGGFQTDRAGGSDGFVARLQGDLKDLLTATYLGGQFRDEINALVIHPTTGAVYVTGETESDDFPQPLSPGGAFQSLDTGIGDDAFVASLSADLLTLNQSTYLGGTDVDIAYAIAIHPTNGNVYVAGLTASDDFPGVTGGMQPVYAGGFLFGDDGFVARLSADLTALVQATYVGGSDDDQIFALAIHPTTGNVYVGGDTFSTDFPNVAGGAQASFAGGFLTGDAFVARLSSALTPSPLTQATYLGGSGDETLAALAIHPTTGQVYVTGSTDSGAFFGDTPFPFTAGGVQPEFGGCLSDVFIARLTSDLTSVPQATYLGLEGFDEAGALAISPLTGDVYVAGDTEGPFPGTDGGAQDTYGGGDADAFVSRLTSTLASGIELALVKAHVGSFRQGQIGATFTLTVSNPGSLPTLDGVTVTVADTLPVGLTATAFDGPGWFCSLIPLECTRTDSLAGLASYPPITLTVDVAVDAPGAVINTASVTGGGSHTHEATDPVTIDPAPNLTIALTHTGNVFLGQNGVVYTATVTNIGLAPTDRGLAGSAAERSGPAGLRGGGLVALDGSPVTVTLTLPPGLTATTLVGSGWTCTLATLTCTRSDSLPNGASYPPIILVVNVAQGAVSPLIVSATVTAGSGVNLTDNTSLDQTIILDSVGVPALSSVVQALVALILCASALLFLRRRNLSHR